jgi:hypothetical protein
MSTWEVLGGNPVPGSPEPFETAAQLLSQVLDAAVVGRQSLLTVAEGSVQWTGHAAASFASSTRSLPSDLGDLHDAHCSAVSALKSYASTLASLQAQAASLLNQALEAQANITSASGQLSQARSAYSDAQASCVAQQSRVDALETERSAASAAADQAAVSSISTELASASAAAEGAASQRTAAATALQVAQSAVASAQEKLAQLRAAAQALSEERENAASAVCTSLGFATEYAVPRRSWWDRVVADTWGGAVTEARFDRHVFDDAMAFSTKYGWFLGPMTGAGANLLGKAVSRPLGDDLDDIYLADSAARIAQDLAEHHWEDAQTEGSGVASSLLMSNAIEDHNLAEALGSIDVSIWSDDAQLFHGIGWDYTFHHLSELNPIAPGAASAVMHAEISGFEPLGSVVGLNILGGVAGMAGRL